MLESEFNGLEVRDKPVRNLVAPVERGNPMAELLDHEELRHLHEQTEISGKKLRDFIDHHFGPRGFAP